MPLDGPGFPIPAERTFEQWLELQKERTCPSTILEHLAAGVQVVWVVNPQARTIHVYRADRSVERLVEESELTAAELIPGLRCRVAELFTLPTPP